MRTLCDSDSDSVRMQCQWGNQPTQPDLPDLCTQFLSGSRCRARPASRRPRTCLPPRNMRIYVPDWPCGARAASVLPTMQQLFRGVETVSPTTMARWLWLTLAPRTSTTSADANADGT